MKNCRQHWVQFILLYRIACSNIQYPLSFLHFIWQKSILCQPVHDESLMVTICNDRVFYMFISISCLKYSWELKNQIFRYSSFGKTNLLCEQNLDFKLKFPPFSTVLFVTRWQSSTKLLIKFKGKGYSTQCCMYSFISEQSNCNFKLKCPINIFHLLFTVIFADSTLTGNQLQ